MTITATYTKEDILDQLDSCARDFTFPVLDNGYVYLADTRLSAYRDEKRWAIIIEVLGYNVRVGGHDAIDNCLYCFGNCLQRPPGIANGDFLSVTDDGPEGPTFIGEYDWHLSGKRESIRIRGHVTGLAVTPEDLVRRGIKLTDPPQVTGADLLRSIAPEHRDLLLATEDELRKRIVPDIPLVLRLDEWHHPDIAGEELPSGSEAFQMIAEVLVTGDKSRYQPTRQPNTDWSNWPGGGTL